MAAAILWLKQSVSINSISICTRFTGHMIKILITTTSPPRHIVYIHFVTLSIGVQCPSSEVRNGAFSTYTHITFDGQFLFGDILYYTCEIGYVVAGTLRETRANSMCTASKDWDRIPVNCERQYQSVSYRHHLCWNILPDLLDLLHILQICPKYIQFLP